MKNLKKEIVFILILLVFIVLSIYYYASKVELSLLNIIAASVTFISILFYVYLIKERIKDIKNSNQIEDEMSKKVKLYAGYYSFRACSYLFFITFLIVNLNHLTIDGSLSGVMGLLMFGSTIIYYSTYLYIKKTANFNE